MQYQIDRMGQAILKKTFICMVPVPMSRFGLEAIAEAAGRASGEKFSVLRDFQKGMPLDVDCQPPSSQGYALLKREGSDGVVVVFA